MINAAYINMMNRKKSPSVMLAFARTFLKYGGSRLIHVINKIHIYRLDNSLIVSINSESLMVVYWDSEEECIDYFLDNMEDTKTSEQKKIFQ